MAERQRVIFSQVTLKPSYSLAANDMVRVNAFFQVGNVGDMTAHHDLCLGLILSHQLAHFPDFENVEWNTADSHDIVAVVAQLFDEAAERRKIKEYGAGQKVDLNQH